MGTFMHFNGNCLNQWILSWGQSKSLTCDFVSVTSRILDNEATFEATEKEMKEANKAY